MNKAIVTIAVGEEYQRLEAVTGVTRKRYAAKYGFDYFVIDNIPQDFIDRHNVAGKSLGFYMMLYKLHLPEIYSEYDFVVFLDADTLLSAGAPNLADYYELIPTKGFAAAQSVFYDERKLFSNWRESYYKDLERLGCGEIPVNPCVHVGSGLLLFKPKEVAEEWESLLNMGGELNEENRLNVSIVQSGRCFMLPPTWNCIWKYEKQRLGILTKNELRNRLYHKFFNLHEKHCLNEVYKRVSLIHLACGEHKKCKWINIDET